MFFIELHHVLGILAVHCFVSADAACSRACTSNETCLSNCRAFVAILSPLLFEVELELE